MRVLVTGGAGFIGSAVADRLVAGGHEVVVADTLLPPGHRGLPDYLNPGARYEWVDLRDGDRVRPLVRGVDAVCHQAAMVGLGVDFADAPDYVAHNALGTANLLAALHAVRFAGRLVVASSMVVYGEGRYACAEHGPVRPGPRRRADLDAGRYEPPCPVCGRALEPEPVDESAAVDPRNVYAATKLHQEHLAGAFGREHGAEVVCLRYHNVYGPRMPGGSPYAGVAALFRSAAERGEVPVVFEDGGQRRDFVHVDDVARANATALTAPPGTGGVYNIASGEPHTVLELAEAVLAAAGDGRRPVVAGGYRLGDVRHVVASPLRARRDLGFAAATPFDAGMRAFATEALR
jgi:dTDP-L-rhamnose 4-epimerase